MPPPSCFAAPGLLPSHPFNTPAHIHIIPYMYTKTQWIELGTTIGQVVADKNAAYGDSVRKVARVVAILYPNGVTVNQIPAMLFTVRILDKLNRIANQPDFGGEDPALDIAGYGLLMQELIANGLNPDCDESV